jgi:penicillin amidase
MAVAMPSIWYQTHLDGGRYHVAGVSLPGVPGVLVGHNQRCAWGLTTAWQDAQDLFIERINPTGAAEYEFARPVAAHADGAGGDRRQGSEPRRRWWRSDLTQHGPLVSELLGESTPLALRWVAQDPADMLGAVLGYNRAANWPEFRASAGHLGRAGAQLRLRGRGRAHRLPAGRLDAGAGSRATASRPRLAGQASTNGSAS